MLTVVQNKVTKEGYVALHIRIGKAVHDTSRNKVTTPTTSQNPPLTTAASLIIVVLSCQFKSSLKPF